MAKRNVEGDAIESGRSDAESGFVPGPAGTEQAGQADSADLKPSSATAEADIQARSSEEPAPTQGPPPDFNIDNPTVLLEDGRELPITKGSFASREGRDWRVRDEMTGAYFEHVATTATGRWVYRPIK